MSTGSSALHQIRHTMGQMLAKGDVGLLITLAFVLPLHKRAVLVVIWALVLSWLLQGDFKGKFRRFTSRGGVITYLAFFGMMILYALGGLYSSDTSKVWFELEKKAALLIFPLLLLSMNDLYLNKKTLRWVFVGFISGVVLGYAYCLFQGYQNYQATGNIAYLYYERFSVLHHPGYYSLYTCFAIAILTFNKISGFRRGFGFLWHFLRWILVIFLVAMLFLVASKAGIIALIMLGLLLFLYYMLIRKAYLAGVALFIASVVLIGAGFYFMQGFVTRFQAMEKLAASMEETTGDVVANGVQVRKLVWNITYQQIIDRPWLGTGTGDYEAQTRQEIENRDLMKTFGGYKNAHNQFLQTTVTLGLGGLVMLVLWLFYPLLMAIRKRNVLYAVFILLLLFNFLVESMLETQSGVLFVSFFHSLLFAVTIISHEYNSVITDAAT